MNETESLILIHNFLSRIVFGKNNQEKINQTCIFQKKLMHI